jgi:CheY-like chemotaxis protein
MNAPRELLRPRVLMVDIEPAMAGLFAEWLAAEGLAADGDAARADPSAALILIDLPFPRQAGRERLEQLRCAWPGVPVVVLSSTLLPGVLPQGEVARTLGAAAVLHGVARGVARGRVASDRCLA